MRFFISHAHEDKAFVDKLSIELVKNNIPLWLDGWEIELGDSLNDKILKGIESSSHFIIVVSKNYFQSEWCCKELVLALEKQKDTKEKILIPLIIDKVEIPKETDLDDVISVDFSESFDNAFKLLIEKIQLISETPSDRKEDKLYTRDWAITDRLDDIFGNNEKNYFIEIDSVDFYFNYQYSIISKIMIIGDNNITKQYISMKEIGLEQLTKDAALSILYSNIIKNPEKYIISLDSGKPKAIKFKSPEVGYQFIARFCIVGKPTTFFIKFDFGSIVNDIFLTRNK